MKKKNASKYPLIQKFLRKTKFNYSILDKQGNEFTCLVKVTYRLYDTLITYHISVPRGKTCLKLAKQEINQLIDDDTLCKYTLKFISYKEFTSYATC